MVKVAPSILSADFANLGQEVEAITTAGADLIHVDVMDGHFVKNITIGPDVVKAIRPYTPLPLDVHLMIDPALAYIEPFAEAGADRLTVHVELENVGKTLALIKKLGKKAGLALSPKTPVEALDPYLREIDLVLVMTVEPGFGGQPFMESQLEKIKTLRANYPDLEIVVDGGINKKTSPLAQKAGVTTLVAGTAIFGHKSYEKAIERLKE